MNPSADSGSFAAANRSWWDSTAEDYHRDHTSYLSSFYWCPEMLHESGARLLGDCSGRTILEIGCGSAPCALWLARTYPTARVLGVDLSLEMMKHARRSDAIADADPLPTLTLVHAHATSLPIASDSIDTAFSAFGALPFLPRLDEVFNEVYRVLRPGGRWVFSVNHPMRWIFRDSPGVDGFEVCYSYFDRSYVERDAHDGSLTYAEAHHTVADYINELVGAGFHVTRVIEPEWPDGLEETWGQWSPLRGTVFPGSLIVCAQSHSRVYDEPS